MVLDLRKVFESPRFLLEQIRRCFTVVHNGSTISATVDLAESCVRGKEWLGTQLEDGAISKSSLKDVASTLTPSKEKDDISDHPNNGVPFSPAVSQQPVSTRNTTPEALIPEINIYTLKLSELSKTPSLSNPGHFCVLKHPSTRYLAVVGRGTRSILSGIFISI